MTDHEKKLRAFISSLSSIDASQLQNDTLLFEQGVIDSLKVIDLIAFLETETDSEIPDELITLDSFRTIESILETFFDEA